MAAIRAALLAVLATGGLLLVGCSSGSGGAHSTSSAGAGGLAPAKGTYAGTSWTVADIQQAGKSVPVPSGLMPTMAFSSNTTIIIDDGLNTLTGVYTPNSTGFTVTNVSTTLTGLAGVSADRVAVITAMDSLTSGGSSPTSVSVKRSGDQLTTKVGDTQLTFQLAAGAGASNVVTTPAAASSS